MTVHIAWLDEADDQKKSQGGVGGNLVLHGGMKPGQLNIMIGTGGGSQIQHNYTNFSDDGETWMRWRDDINKAELRVSGEWLRLNPEVVGNQHPLDFGKIVDVGTKEDLAEIQAQYENHIKSSPWLQQLRRDYDEAVERHELFDAIKGDDDA